MSGQRPLLEVARAYAPDILRGIGAVVLFGGLLYAVGHSTHDLDEHHQAVRTERVDVYVRADADARRAVVLRLGYNADGSAPVACTLAGSAGGRVTQECPVAGARSLTSAESRAVAWPDAPKGRIDGCRVEGLSCIDLRFEVPDVDGLSGRVDAAREAADSAEKILETLRQTQGVATAEEGAPKDTARRKGTVGAQPRAAAAATDTGADGVDQDPSATAEEDAAAAAAKLADLQERLQQMTRREGWLHVGWVMMPVSPDRPDYQEHMHLVMAYQSGDMAPSDEPISPTHSVLLDAARAQPDGPLAVLRSSPVPSAGGASGGFALYFGQPYGVLHSYGSLPGRLSALFASVEQTITNAIIGLLGAGLLVVILGLFALQLQVRPDRFLPRGWRPVLMRRGSEHARHDIQALASIRDELDQVNVDRLAQVSDHDTREALRAQGKVPPLAHSIRFRLHDLAAKMDRCHLKLIFQSVTDEWRAGHRLPTESVHAYLDDLSERLDSRTSLAVLELLAAGAPALGFLGTAIGMARAFQEMDTVQITGDGGFATAMKVALITTILGLIVRVLALAVLRIDESIVSRRLALLRSRALQWAMLYNRALALEVDPNEPQTLADGVGAAGFSMFTDDAAPDDLHDEAEADHGSEAGLGPAPEPSAA